MKTIEEYLRAAAEKGELNYFTLFPIHGTKPTTFKAQVGKASATVNFSADDKDPAKAALTALEAHAKRKSPTPKRKPHEPADDDTFGDDTEFG
jgi:hypothetical protein